MALVPRSRRSTNSGIFIVFTHYLGIQTKNKQIYIRMDPEQFRTLSELVEEDVAVGKQKHCIHALAYEENGDTLRSAYSNTGKDDDSVYFSIAGSRASSLMMGGGGTIKSASFSESKEDVSDSLEDDVGEEDNTYNHTECEQNVFCGGENPTTQNVFPHAFSFDQGGAGAPDLAPKEDMQCADQEEPDSRARIHTPTEDLSSKEEGLDSDSGEDVDKVTHSRRLLSEAESVGPVLFSDNTADRTALHLPTPIHEEEKGREASPEKRQHESPCRVCVEREEHVAHLQESLDHLKQELSRAYSDIDRYKKEIKNMREDQSSSRDDQLEELREEMRYLQVVHTNEISLLYTENGMLRQQLQDQMDEYVDEAPPRPQRPRPQARPTPQARPRPQHILIPPPVVEHRHTDSPDQIGYSPLGAARIQFK